MDIFFLFAMIPLPTIHTHYSLMWGTASPQRLCAAARRLGYKRLALTDTDNLYGLWPFLDACQREGIEPRHRSGDHRSGHGGNGRFVWWENAAGYANLCRLITRRHGGGFL